MLAIGKCKFDKNVSDKMRADTSFKKDLSYALFSHTVCMFDENCAEHLDEVKNNKRVTAIFPTVCGKVILDTLADRSKTYIRMA